LKNDDVTPNKSMSVEAKFAVAVLVTLALCFWWLLSDREPIQKEMTLAYRKHILAIDGDRNSKELAEIIHRLHAVELIKQRCARLDDKRYRCESIVLENDHPVEGHPAVENAIYIHDTKGWRFEAIGKEWRPPG
jgi:hypothetical protein